MAIGKQDGFTLIELMITTAVVAILAAVAYPSYTSYVIRANRAAAKAQMLDIVNREQQFLLSSRAYGTLAALQAAGYSLPSELAGKYTPTIDIGATVVPSFTVTFTAIGKQASDGPLTYNSEGVKGCGTGCNPSTKW